MEREDKEKEAEAYEKNIPGYLGECQSKQKDTEDITLRTDTIAGNNTKTVAEEGCSSVQRCGLYQLHQ